MSCLCKILPYKNKNPLLTTNVNNTSFALVEVKVNIFHALSRIPSEFKILFLLSSMQKTEMIEEAFAG